MSTPLKRLQEVAQLFFQLGSISFGGPAGHIALMETEVVKRRQWLTQDEFLDLLGATNLIPGPNSTEMAIHIGYLYAGWLGLIVAGVSFILPAAVITAIFAWIYVTYGTLPQMVPVLYGIKPVVVAIVLNAIWRLGNKAIKTQKLLIIALAVGTLSLFTPLNEVLVLLIGGILGMIWLQISDHNFPPKEQTHLLLAWLTANTTQITATVSTSIETHAVSLWQLGLFFLKVGSVLFGGGYLLIAFLETGLVQEYGWLTQQQLLDAIAVGQFTPGPILSTATFVGYIIAKTPGAIIATLGIFLPSFLCVIALNPVLPYLRRSKWTSAFLDAVNVSAVALMAVVILQLGLVIFTYEQPPYLDFLALGITLIAAILAIRFQVTSVWLVLGGALCGWGVFLLGYIP